MIFALLSGFLVAVIIFHICAIKRYGMSAVIFKGIASALFVSTGAWMLYHGYTQRPLPESLIPFIGNVYSEYYLYIFIGLICGLLGDVLLAFRNLFTSKRKQFIALGMITFGLGHLVYAIAPTLSLIAINPAWIIVPGISGVVIALLIWKLAPHLGMKLGKFTVPVILYSFIIVFLLSSILLNCIICSSENGFSIGNWKPFLPVLLFTISDFLLSMNYFDKEQKPMSAGQIIVIHVAYYLAQLLFALGFTLPSSL